MSGNKRGCASAGQSPLCVGNRWAGMGGDSDWAPVDPDEVAEGRVVLGDAKLELADVVSVFDEVPEGANHAEIHVWSSAGCGAVWTVSGVDPDHAGQVGHRTSDGGSIELESAAEIAAFKAITLDGCDVSLHTTFFKLDAHVE